MNDTSTNTKPPFILIAFVIFLGFLILAGLAVIIVEVVDRSTQPDDNIATNVTYRGQQETDHPSQKIEHSITLESGESIKNSYVSETKYLVVETVTKGSSHRFILIDLHSGKIMRSIRLTTTP